MNDTYKELYGKINPLPNKVVDGSCEVNLHYMLPVPPSGETPLLSDVDNMKNDATVDLFGNKVRDNMEAWLASRQTLADAATEIIGTQEPHPAQARPNPSPGSQFIQKLPG